MYEGQGAAMQGEVSRLLETENRSKRIKRQRAGSASYTCRSALDGIAGPNNGTKLRGRVLASNRVRFQPCPGSAGIGGVGWVPCCIHVGVGPDVLEPDDSRYPRNLETSILCRAEHE